jgi:hypothetical protein
MALCDLCCAVVESGEVACWQGEREGVREREMRPFYLCRTIESVSSQKSEQHCEIQSKLARYDSHATTQGEHAADVHLSLSLFTSLPPDDNSLQRRRLGPPSYEAVQQQRAAAVTLHPFSFFPSSIRTLASLNTCPYERARCQQSQDPAQRRRSKAKAFKGHASQSRRLEHLPVRDGCSKSPPRSVD